MINDKNIMNYIDRMTPQYVAGLFDGEGCVSSSFDSYGNVKLRVEISQNNIYILSLILLKAPGDIVSYTQKNKSGSISTGFRLRWNGKDCLNILEYIKDHVVIKAGVVETGIKLANLFQSCGGNGYQLSEEMKKERIDLKDKITVINGLNKSKAVA